MQQRLQPESDQNTEQSVPGVSVPHFDWRTVMSAKDDSPGDMAGALDKYFACFAQPPLTEKDGKPHLGDHPCLKCDEPLTGMVAMMLGKGGFTWGIAHGEGFCRNCRWPARAYHFIKYEDGRDLATLRNFILQYHPDVVMERTKENSVSEPSS